MSLNKHVGSYKVGAHNKYYKDSCKTVKIHSQKFTFTCSLNKHIYNRYSANWHTSCQLHLYYENKKSMKNNFITSIFKHNGHTSILHIVSMNIQCEYI